jgi:hypothetical protein
LTNSHIKWLHSAATTTSCCTHWVRHHRQKSKKNPKFVKITTTKKLQKITQGFLWLFDGDSSHCVLLTHSAAV